MAVSMLPRLISMGASALRVLARGEGLTALRVALEGELPAGRGLYFEFRIPDMDFTLVRFQSYQELIYSILASFHHRDAKARVEMYVPCHGTLWVALSAEEKRDVRQLVGFLADALDPLLQPLQMTWAASIAHEGTHLP